MPKNEHFRITSKTKSGRPISPPWQATSAVSRLSRQKIAPNQKTRSDRDWRSSITPTHATMAAIVAPVAILAPRVTAPKARAARTLRASTFNGVKVAQPKVRAGRRSLCRGKTPLHGACDIFRSSHLASARASRATVAPAGRNPACGARGWHARYPFVAFPFGRSCFAPRGTHDRPGSGPVAFRRRRSFPRRLPWRSWKHRRAADFFLTFCRTRKREFVKSRRRRAPRDASRRRLTSTDCHDCRDD